MKVLFDEDSDRPNLIFVMFGNLVSGTLTVAVDEWIYRENREWRSFYSADEMLQISRKLHCLNAELKLKQYRALTEGDIVIQLEHNPQGTQQ